MPIQKTFTLVPERAAAPSDAPIRPMTSKQVKKAHKVANKEPKLSRAEQRKLELAEQERIRKELEKERTAARAHVARERKKAKEEAKKEEKRRRGKPLIEVRPSQDTISRFVRGNGTGKKRDGRGLEVGKMTVLEEETSVVQTEPAEDSCETSLGAKASPIADENQMEQSYHEKEGDQNYTPEGGVASPEPAEGAVDELMEGRDGMATLTPSWRSVSEDQHRDLTTAALDPLNDIGQQNRTHENTIQDMSFDDFDDDLLVDLGSFGRNQTQAADLGENGPTELGAQREDLEEKDLSEDELEDDALQALGAMFDQASWAKSRAGLPSLQLSPVSRHDQKHATGREFSSFAEEDLDDEVWRQLETRAQPKPMAIEEPVVAAKPGNSEKPNIKPRRPSACERDLGLDLDPSPQQHVPLSTQAVLLNLDEYFPSLSQQELELVCESIPAASQPSPCPPPRKTEVSRQVSTESATLPQKRFFSASGSNEMLSLALHRSRRTAALENIHQQERHRFEAGLVTKPQEQRLRTHKPPRHSTSNLSSMGPPLKPPAAGNGTPAGAARPPKFKQRTEATSKPQSVHGQNRPPFKPAKPTLSGKENKPPEDMAPSASQETEYGGDWVDEIAQELMNDPVAAQGIHPRAL